MQKLNSAELKIVKGGNREPGTGNSECQVSKILLHLEKEGFLGSGFYYLN